VRVKRGESGAGAAKMGSKMCISMKKKYFCPQQL
jgi:hypothetical protein